MAYSQEYYECKRKIDDYQTKLKKLDSDFKIVQECKALLADSSLSLRDMLTQCDDIKGKFDRATIEGKYDSYQITFNNKDIVFEYLDSIVAATNTFSTSCENIKNKIDIFGNSLDDVCKSIADEAKEVSNTILRLKANLRIHEMQAYQDRINSSLK